MQLSGSGAADPRWLEKIFKHPPTSLSTLEYWIGSIDVDFAGSEGMGHVSRPAKPARGNMRPEIRHASMKFWVDMHHEDPQRVRDMTLGSFTARLNVKHAHVVQLAEWQLGTGRTIATTEGTVVEYGEWFYLRELPDGFAQLEYEQQRPEWAMPAPMPNSREHLLAALFDRLVCDTTLEPIITAIEPLVAEASAELNTINKGVIYITFRPGLPLETLLRVFRWEHPRASARDVHMTAWCVYPERPGVSWSVPHVGPWFVDAMLDGWPHGPGGAELRITSNRAPSREYDLSGCENKVFSIGVRLPR
jgi:hypothetical protein